MSYFYYHSDSQLQNVEENNDNTCLSGVQDCCEEQMSKLLRSVLNICVFNYENIRLNLSLFSTLSPLLFIKQIETIFPFLFLSFSPAPSHLKGISSFSIPLILTVDMLTCTLNKDSSLSSYPYSKQSKVFRLVQL